MPFPLCRLALAALLALPLAGRADPFVNDLTFASEAAFLAHAGSVAFESFEGLAATPRAASPIVTARFTLVPGEAPIGVQDGPDSPLSGFGSAAVDGTHYVSVYLPGVPQGTLHLQLAAPTTAVGFYITDVGEAPGEIGLRTNAGGYSSGVLMATFPPLQGNGNVQFIGLTQSVAFTQLDITVTGVDDAYGLDKVYVSAVPEPAQAGLLAAGLLLLGGRLLRRR
jgi:hypothetical protein